MYIYIDDVLDDASNPDGEHLFLLFTIVKVPSVSDCCKVESC